MAKYRLRPIIVDAFRFGKEPMPDWAKCMVGNKICNIEDDYCQILTPEGWRGVTKGNYIIKYDTDVLFVCVSSLFYKKFEEDSDA